jgi:tetratricopeptide (TPR) repeat protein
LAENPRIEELRRRVQKDPASIAFAQLAEEFRRSGNYEEAIAICRVGLQTHPSYLSARVTLGRALLELNDFENAETELRYVLHHAAENLAAIRAMAEIHHRRGELIEALALYKSALELARHDPDLEQTVDEISRTINKVPAPVPAPVVPPPAAAVALTAEQASAEFLRNTFDLLELDPLDLEPEPSAPSPDPSRGENAQLESAEAAPQLKEEETVSEAAWEAEAVQLGGEAWDAEVTQASGEAWRAETPQPSGEDTGAELLEANDHEQGDGPPRANEEERAEESPSQDMPRTNPALLGLERFLEAIHSYRQRTAV